MDRDSECPRKKSLARILEGTIELCRIKERKELFFELSKRLYEALHQAVTKGKRI
jgi:hypothetical protein